MNGMKVFLAAVAEKGGRIGGMRIEAEFAPRGEVHDGSAHHGLGCVNARQVRGKYVPVAEIVMLLGRIGRKL